MPGPSWVVSSLSERWGARTHANLSADEQFFVENAARATTIAESQDPHACYSYDDYALAELDGIFYVFQTSGCSCPDPAETWVLEKRGTREEILDYLDRPGHEAFAEFKRQIQAAGWTLRTPAPEPVKRGSW